MTRKRFVKLLMAQGMQRNEAQAKARIVQEIGCSYNEAFVALMMPNITVTFTAAVEILKDAIIKAGEAIRSFAEKLHDKAGG